MFKKVDPKLNLPEEEKKILEFWRENKTFEKSLQKESPKGNFVFYEGPPTANGKPGIHHVLNRAFKDLFNRYKTMQGYNVRRKAGWDTQGLPVELQVEKELGISGKGEIENIVPGDKNASVAKFNKLCKDSVFVYKSEWEKMTERMAYWLNMKDPYVTYDAKYIESIWWVISQADKKGLLYKGHKVVPYCPRCGTALSSHEVAQGYRNVEEESVYIKVKSLYEEAYFLVWTTTPWTLAGNAALAFGPNIKYVLAEKDGDKYILSKSRLEALLPGAKVIKEMSGEEIVKDYQVENGPDYEAIYPDGDKFSEGGEKVYKLIAAPFVTDSDGTGIVHIAPAFGEDDYNAGYKEQGIKVLKTVDEKGTELAGAGRGSFVKDADEEIKIDLEKRGILFKKEMFAHDYPFCWRCDSPLLYFAKDSWYVAMSKLRDELLKNNETINWNPNYLKHGRFGNWLENINDWAISRDRYWGTPLPVWACDKCDEKKVVGNFMDFNESDKKVTKLVFVRHGESEKNVQGVRSNTIDKWPLTEKGKRQAEDVAEKLASEKYDVMISSPVLRARETADIVASKLGMEYITDELVSEYDWGKWNDVSDQDLLNLPEYQKYKEIKKDSLEAAYNYKLGETGESKADVTARVNEFIEKISKEYAGKTVLVISHGGINAAIEKNLHEISIPEYFYHETNEAMGCTGVLIEYLNQNGTAFDPHKPYVDEIEFSCKCGGTMKRTPEVMDVWFDSGSMPYAQYHYPFENSELFLEQYPADFICEAIDQTRGWFYTLLAISTMVKGDACFKNVISTGHILDEKGQKMSKSKGNIVEPMSEFEKVGADVVRFFLYSVNQPGEPKLFSEKELMSVSRNLFITLWNVYSFFMMYAAIDQWKPSQNSSLISQNSNVLDKWILAKYNELVETITESLNNYDTYKPANALLDFVNELSTWYVRRSRRRFWKSESDSDKESAYHTLYEVLLGLSKLLAPFTPMFAETLYLGLRQENDPESVHLTDFPVATEFDLSVLDEMSETRQIVEAGLAKRSEVGIKVRQPLASLEYSGKKLSKDLEAIIAEEVNVKKVENSGAGEAKVELDTVITDELKIEGAARELIRNIQSLRKKSGFEVENRISVNYETSSEIMKKVINSMSETIAKEVLAKEIVTGKKEDAEGSEEFEVDGEKIWIGLSRI